MKAAGSPSAKMHNAAKRKDQCNPQNNRHAVPAALLRSASQSLRHCNDNTSQGPQCAFSINPTGSVLHRYVARFSAAVDTRILPPRFPVTAARPFRASTCWKRLCDCPCRLRPAGSLCNGPRKLGYRGIKRRAFRQWPAAVLADLLPAAAARNIGCCKFGLIAGREICARIIRDTSAHRIAFPTWGGFHYAVTVQFSDSIALNFAAAGDKRPLRRSTMPIVRDTTGSLIGIVRIVG